MSDSVGKIILDLEIQSDISKQISNVSSMIGKGLKKSLDGGIKGTLDNMNNTTKKTMSNVMNTINSSLKSSVGKIKNTMQAAFSSMKNFKLPSIKFPKPTNMTQPKVADVSTVTSGRAPPMPDMSVLSSHIDNVSRTLDNTNARIEQQKVKLAQLREEYSTCFNPGRKNGLEEKILKTEASINKLIGTSDKLGFKLADLDSQFKKSSSGANSTSNSTNKLKNALSGINNASNKASNGLKNLSNSTKKASNSMSQHSSNIGIIVRSMFTWGIVFPIVLKGLTALATTIGQGLMTNQQFANSFNQIKTNMMVAFTPILQAILPALNTLMAALSKATTYMASFISNIFGKSYQQSYQATQQLIDAKVAMGAYGDSAKKAAKDVKGLAAIDEINTLGASNANIAGVNDKIPQMVAPPVDTSAVDSSMKSIVDKIKGYFATIDFTPLKNSFTELKAAITPIIDNVGKILGWFMDKILKPLGKWTMEDAIPAFLNLLSGALEVLNPILEVFMDLGSWLWDNFLQPIASWTGGIIVDILNGLAEVLKDIGAWMKEHKGVIEAITIVVGSFALAWGLVSLATNIGTIALGVWSVVSGIATVAATALGTAIGFLNTKMGIITLVIGAVIAIGVLLYKNWDWIKATAIEVWDAIKEKFNQFKEWLGNVFATDWSEKFGGFGDILNGFLANIKNIWDSIKRIFGGIIDFVGGIFSGDWERVWKGVSDIFGGIMDGLEAIVKAPLNGIIGLINAAIGGLNKIQLPSIDIPFFGEVGGWGFDIPKIPYLAKGGVINQPTLAMVGEAGKEAVVPLENNTQGLDLLAAKLMERLGGYNGGQLGDDSNSGDTNITIQFGTSSAGKFIIDSINKANKKAGKNLIVTI